MLHLINEHTVSDLSLSSLSSAFDHSVVMDGPKPLQPICLVDDLFIPFRDILWVSQPFPEQVSFVNRDVSQPLIAQNNFENSPFSPDVNSRMDLHCDQSSFRQT